jgi:pimeloyl-ACP methyl ester carboxylesterase
VAAGGIEAVLATEHFAAMVRASPVSGETLRQMGAEAFTAAMKRSVAGISPEDMRRITMPAIVIPGNDRVHPPGAGQAAHRLLPNSVYQEVLTQVVDADVDLTGWEAATGTLASRFIDFLRQRAPG